MKVIVAAAILLAACCSLSEPAQAKGCIRGAIVGGVAGHAVGHGALGAVAGCFVGMHEAHKAAAERRAQQAGATQPAGTAPTTH